jgi:hypothetical protein
VKLAHATVACLAGAGLALYAATRVWSVAVTTRPGLPDLRAETTGAAEQPWLIALAVVALAGTGALLATRGVVRRGLGGLLILVGAGVAVAAIAARAGLGGGASLAGPIACVAGAALIIWGGLGAARRGHEWPAMGARYERRAVPSLDATLGAGSGPPAAAGLSAGGGASTPAAASVAAEPPAGADSSGPAGPDRGSRPEGRAGPDGGSRPEGRAGLVENRVAWDALDRGDDPTDR